MSCRLSHLKDDIEKTKYMLEHASSKPVEYYYKKSLMNLVDALGELTDGYQTVRAKQNIYPEQKSDAKLCHSMVEKLATPEYRGMINVMTVNAGKHLNKVTDTVYSEDYIPEKDAKDIIKDFINYYDQSLYPIINKAIDNEHLSFNNLGKKFSGSGYSFFNAYSNSPHIVAYTNRANHLNFGELSCIVHELGHIIHFTKMLNKPNNYTNITSNNFVEVPSTTLETLFINYLIKNRIYIDDTNIIAHNSLHFLKQFVKNLGIINSFIDIVENNDYDQIKQILLEKNLETDDITISEYINHLNSYYQYTFGGLIAFYYLEQYKMDKELAKKNINDFTSNIGIMTDKEMLNNFNIDFDKFIKCEYLKNPVAENQKTFKTTSI